MEKYAVEGRRFLVFDLGETLINFNLDGMWRKTLENEVIPRMYTALLAQSKEFNEKRPNPVHFSKVVYRHIAVETPEEKKISMISRVKKYFEFFGIPPMASYVQSQIAAFASTMHNRVKIYPEVHDTLERLVQEGYHIGLWSDTPWQCPGSVIEQYMLKYKIRRFFDVALFSGDKDNKKPNPEVFQMVLNVAEQPKDQMVYIGNSEKDILTSHRFGVPVVWVNRPDNEIELTKDSPEPDYEIESLDQIFEILPIS